MVAPEKGHSFVGLRAIGKCYLFFVLTSTLLQLLSPHIPLASANALKKSKSVLCADEKCELLYGKGRTLTKYPSPDKDILGFKKDVPVLIYGKTEDSKYFYVEINKSRGLVSTKHVQEESFQNPDLTFKVDLGESVHNQQLPPSPTLEQQLDSSASATDSSDDHRRPSSETGASSTAEMPGLASAPLPIYKPDPGQETGGFASKSAAVIEGTTFYDDGDLLKTATPLPTYSAGAVTKKKVAQSAAETAADAESVHKVEEKKKAQLAETPVSDEAAQQSENDVPLPMIENVAAENASAVEGQPQVATELEQPKSEEEKEKTAESSPVEKSQTSETEENVNSLLTENIVKDKNSNNVDASEVPPVVQNRPVEIPAAIENQSTDQQLPVDSAVPVKKVAPAVETKAVKENIPVKPKLGDISPVLPPLVLQSAEDHHQQQPVIPVDSGVPPQMGNVGESVVPHYPHHHSPPLPSSFQAEARIIPPSGEQQPPVGQHSHLHQPPPQPPWRSSAQYQTMTPPQEPFSDEALQATQQQQQQQQQPQTHHQQPPPPPLPKLSDFVDSASANQAAPAPAPTSDSTVPASFPASDALVNPVECATGPEAVVNTTTTTTTTTTITTTTTTTTNNNNSKSTQQSTTSEQQHSAGGTTVDDIIRMKVASSPTKDMLSFEEWRKKISEQMEHSEQQKQQQRDLNLLNQHQLHQQQQLLQDSQSLNGEQATLKAASSPSTVNINGNGNGKPISTASTSQTLPTNRARNFASHECGAKIVDSNAEADFVNRVLNEQTDEYMLNPCKTANWFVIELCETIQPAYLEMANFELYSSIPKEFSVAASEHYPARGEWSVLGTFTAADVRTVQGFKLANNGFVKYLRVQLHSYYGAEHFCPVSVMRVYGTSLFDEVERIDKPNSGGPLDGLAIVDSSAQHQTTVVVKEEEGSSIAEEPALVSTSTSTPAPLPATATPSKTPVSTSTSTPTTTGEHPNLFGSAKNAVYSIVMRALNSNVFHRILDNFSSVNSSGKDQQARGSGNTEGTNVETHPPSNIFNVHDQSVVIRLYSRYERYLDACETFFSSGGNQLTFNQSHCTLHIPRQCIYLRYLLFPGHLSQNSALFDQLYTQYVIRRYINGGLLFQCAYNRSYAQMNATGLSLLIANARLQQQLNKGKGSKSLLPTSQTMVNLSGVDGHQLVNIVEEGLHQHQHQHLIHQTITSSSLVDQINHSSGDSLATSVTQSIISSSSILLIPDSLTTENLQYNFTIATSAAASSIESSIIAPTVVHQPVIGTHRLPSSTISFTDSSVAASESIVLMPLDNSSAMSTEKSSPQAEVKQLENFAASSDQQASSHSSSSSISQQSSPSSPSLSPLPPPPAIESYQTGEATSPSGEVLSSNSGQSKEAVIIRLTNRIKHLEKNISLMSTYLENLSVRYRNQMEEMQLIFNKTIEHLNNTAIRAAEKDAKQQENIMTLESEINKLKAAIEEVKGGGSTFDLYSWLAANRDHLLLMAAELLLVILICCLFLSRRAQPSISNPTVAISHAEHLLINAQLTGSNVKKSLHRSKSLSDLPDEQQLSNPPSDRSTLAEEVVVEKTTEKVDNCDTTTTTDDDSISVSSNKENCLGVCSLSNGSSLVNGGTLTSVLLGNGIVIQRPLADRRGILNESNGHR